ncbi:MAG: Maf family protein [Clostridia bacterium]
MSLSALILKTLKFSKIILASRSPRRCELLSQLVNNFVVAPNDAPELTFGKRPSAVVMSNAKAKSLACKERGLIISADTIVFMDGKYYLKPKSRQDAFEMLKSLSNRTHFVYTGVCLRDGSHCAVFYEKSQVKLKRLSDEIINKYIDTQSPLDKAGAYGIQDNIVVQAYKGSYTNIIGLPIERLGNVLKTFGYDCSRRTTDGKY